MADSIAPDLKALGRGLAAGTACAMLLILATPAPAQVMQIDEDGAVALRSGAGAVSWSGRDHRESEAGGPAEAVDVPAGATISSISPPAAYVATVDRVALASGISPALLEAVVWQESRWRADATSRVGARGLTQLMPATARALGVDPRDPVANLAGGARYLRAQLDLFDGDLEKALAAYNAGPARVLRAGGVPPIAETRAYVAAILGRLAPPVEGAAR